MTQYVGTYRGLSFVLAQALASHIRLRAGLSKDERIDFGMTLGTGWKEVPQELARSDNFTVLASLPFSDLFGFGDAGVEGHAGEVLIARWHRIVCTLLLGRLHLNEGPQQESNDRVRLMGELLRAFEIRRLLITNASGAYNPDFNVGDVMMATDFFDLFNQTVPMYSSEPGQDCPFPFAVDGLNSSLQEVTERVASNVPGLKLQKGCFVWTHGPYLGGPANTRIARQLGIDAVGMSGWNEVALAAKFGQKALMLCFLTDIAGEKAGPDAHAEHTRRGVEASPRLAALLDGIVAEHASTLA